MQAQYGYDGLRQRPKYDEIVSYLTDYQQMLRYPNRFAKQMREHPYMTQLDGDGFMEMQDQQEAINKQQLINQQVQHIVNNTYISEAQARATVGRAEPDIQASAPAQPPPPPPPPGGSVLHGAGRVPRSHTGSTKVPFNGGQAPPSPPPPPPDSGGLGSAAAAATAYQQPSPFPYPFSNPIFTSSGGHPPPPGGGGAQLKARKKFGITKVGRNADVISTSGNNPQPPPPPGGSDAYMFNPGSYMPEDFTFAPEGDPMEAQESNQYPGDDGHGGGSSSKKARKKIDKVRVFKNRVLVAVNFPVPFDADAFRQLQSEVEQLRRRHLDDLAMINAQNLKNVHNNNEAPSAMTFIEQQAERAIGADQVAPAPDAIPEAPRGYSRSRSPPITTNTTETRGRSPNEKPITGSTALLIERLKHNEGGASSTVPRELQIGEQRHESFDISTPRREDTKGKPSRAPSDDEGERSASTVVVRPSKKPKPTARARSVSAITVEPSKAPSRSQSVVNSSRAPSRSQSHARDRTRSPAVLVSPPNPTQPPPPPPKPKAKAKAGRFARAVMTKKQQEQAMEKIPNEKKSKRYALNVGA